MAQATELTRYPKAFRSGGVLSLELLGHTFTPKPGSPAARALEDEVLRLQVTDKIFRLSGDQECAFTVRSASGNVNRMLLQVVVPGDDDLTQVMCFLVELRGDELVVGQAAINTERNGQPLDHRTIEGDEVDLQHRTIEALTIQTPELKARVRRTIWPLEAAGPTIDLAAKAHRVKARALALGDVILVHNEGGADHERRIFLRPALVVGIRHAPGSPGLPVAIAHSPMGQRATRGHGGDLNYGLRKAFDGEVLRIYAVGDPELNAQMVSRLREASVSQDRVAHLEFKDAKS